MFFFVFKQPGCWGRCHSLTPLELRDRNRMMDYKKAREDKGDREGIPHTRSIP